MTTHINATAEPTTMDSTDTQTGSTARVSVPDYRGEADLSAVEEGDSLTFTTRTNRSNGVRLGNPRTLTVDSVTIEEREKRVWDDNGSEIVAREVTEQVVDVVAVEDGYRYRLRQEGTDVVRVSSCKQSDYVDQHEHGVFNAVARSNVSHGYITSWDHARN